MTKQMVRVDVSFEHDRWLASTEELGCAAAYSTHREMRARYPHVLADRLDTDVASIDIEWRGLDPVVRELLDKAADSLRLAHEISMRTHSGRAMTDYLHAQHAIKVYRLDLQACPA